MKVLRLLLTLSFLLLSGCLVVFREPLPASAPPMALLGEWTRSNEWGEQVYLVITHTEGNQLKARLMVGSPDNLGDAEVYDFSVTHSGHRWYLSSSLPKRFGDSLGIGGFEINKRNELLVYSLEQAPFIEAIRDGRLQGQVIETGIGDSALVTAPAEQVLAFLDDPANSDVFVEVASYQRTGK